VQTTIIDVEYWNPRIHLYIKPTLVCIETRFAEVFWDCWALLVDVCMYVRMQP
jgi:hypothetical protein